MTALTILRDYEAAIQDAGHTHAWFRTEMVRQPETMFQDGLEPGAKVATQRGEVPVGALRPGDEVIALHFGGLMRVARAGPYVATLPAVRIKAHAFEPGRPHTDMIVGSDQRIMVRDAQGVALLLTAASLVNGATILNEPARPRELWFVELSSHTTPSAVHADIFVADGLAIGSRGGIPIRDAPEETLVATRQRLLDNAMTLGWQRAADPDVHIMLGRTRLNHAVREGQTIAFDIPAGHSTLHLCSLFSRPIELEAASTDWRRLGVAISRIAFQGTELPLDDERLEDGFYGVETDGDTQWRWTDGDGVMRLEGAGRLEVTIRFAASCWKVREKRFLAVRHAEKAPDHYEPFLQWLGLNFPEIRSRFDLDFLPPRKRAEDYALVIPWLQDPIQQWSSLAYHQACELADSCARAGVPLVNHPSDLVNAAKSTSLARMTAIGARTPRAMSLLTHSIAEVQAAIPGTVIVREDWGHGSLSFRLAPDDLANRHVVSRYVRPVAIEFIETVSPDNHYRKFRYLATGDRGISVHMVASTEWEVRVSNRVITEELLAEDRAYISALDPNHHVLQAARRALDLDFVAFDYAYDQKGDLVVWEANPFPAMNFGRDVEDLMYRHTAVHRCFAAMAGLYLDRAGIAVPEVITILRSYDLPGFEEVVDRLRHPPV